MAKYVDLIVEDLRTRVRFPPPPPFTCFTRYYKVQKALMNKRIGAFFRLIQTTLVKNIFYDQLTDNIMINLYFAISERISALQWYIISLCVVDLYIFIPRGSYLIIGI